MASYFKLSCFGPETTGNLIMTSNIILVVLGIIHWGYCIALVKYLELFYKFVNKPNGGLTFLDTYQQIKTMYDSPIAFYAVAGVQQVISSVLIILAAKSIIWTTAQSKWSRVLACLLLFNFSFNFCVGVNSAMSSTYYEVLFKKQLETLDKLTTATIVDDYILLLPIIMKYIRAEAVLSFLFAIPLIALTTIALAEKYFKPQTDTKPSQAQNHETIVELDERRNNHIPSTVPSHNHFNGKN